MARRSRVPSLQQVKVLQAFLETESTHGYDLMKMTGIGSGTLYTLLKRLFDEGYVHKEAEIVNGRCRIHYRLTQAGQKYAERALFEHDFQNATNL